MDPEIDSENLQAMLTRVRGRWNVDPAHMLLTGMSDGGTFTLLSGLAADRRSPTSRRSRRHFIRCCWR